ncbi:hypothetical protein OEZ85_010263 [Tetradesmus obliquus]|uniref:Peptidase S8/S53 domain-containing protein n=1 Tax=Tetradesmus obliquus TaxID=3088 RepID=A0ABY8TRH3_TETOB|nr:hypothetical protein OEZ85_010263 [Tetradesmus obliquus]
MRTCLLLLFIVSSTSVAYSRSTALLSGTATRSPSRRNLLAEEDPTDPSNAPGLTEYIRDTFIVAFTQEAGHAAIAAAMLVEEVQAALQQQQQQRQQQQQQAASALSTASAVDERAAAASSEAEPGAAGSAAGAGIQLLKTIGQDPAAEVPGAFGSNNSTPVPAEPPARMQAAVVTASPEAMQFVKASPLVKAVIQDQVIIAQPMGCVEQQFVGSGVSAVPRSTFSWPACYTSRSRLIWRGITCGDGSMTFWTQIQAVDRVSGSLLLDAQRRPCILYRSIDRTYNLQNFGACGTAPMVAPGVPARICSATGGGGGGGSGGGGSGGGGGVGNSPGTGQLLRKVPVVSGETVPDGVRRIEAVTAAGIADTTTGVDVTVGVMDSGVDATHPDLNYVGGTTWSAASKKKTYDVTNPDVDYYGHGTHVAGIIGARNNGLGVVGVAAGIPLYSLKILDADGAGALSSAMDAVNWVASASGGQSRRIRIINMSFAGYVDPTSPDYQATLDMFCAPFNDANKAGVAIFAAAGNYGSSYRGYLPASCPSVMAVTAVDSTSNRPASFSSWLPDSATAADKATVMAAPGTAINSTISFSVDPSGYRELSGTSSATPHVAGVAATCIKSGTCAAGITGSQVYAALQAAASERRTLAGRPAFGFTGDPASTINGKYMGNMIWAKF